MYVRHQIDGFRPFWSEIGYVFAFFNISKFVPHLKGLWNHRFWSYKISRFGPHTTTLTLFVQNSFSIYLWKYCMVVNFALTFVLYFFSETSTWALSTWIAHRLAWVSFPHSRLLIHCRLWENGVERLFGHASGTVTSWWRRIGTSRRGDD